METHSSILVWEIPWTEEPGGIQSMGVAKESDTLFRVLDQIHSGLNYSAVGPEFKIE